jgi:hypothetical protein
VDEIPLGTLALALIVLLIVSGFFSVAETAMMAANRYRLKHQAQRASRGARLALALLAQTDRLLGVILLGKRTSHKLAQQHTGPNGAIALAGQISGRLVSVIFIQPILNKQSHALCILLDSVELVCRVSAEKPRITRIHGIDHHKVTYIQQAMRILFQLIRRHRHRVDSIVQLDSPCSEQTQMQPC